MGGDDGAGAAVVEVVRAHPRPAGPLTALLGDDERARLVQLRSAVVRDRFATAHALLRLVVSRWTGTAAGELVLGATCRWCGGDHGAPELRTPAGFGLHLSLSRSGAEVLVAVTRLGPVGVDSERPVAEDFDGFDGVALTAGERAAIERLAPDRRAQGRAILWARKEAVLKATGHGLMTDPSEVEVPLPFAPAHPIAWRDDGGGTRTVQLLDLPLPPGASGAVAVLGERPPELVLVRGDELLDRW